MIVELGLGAAVGAVMALTGAGGGILAVPLLVFGAKLQMAQAAPIGLLAVGIAAASGAVMGLRERTVRYRAALMMAGTGVVMAPLGVIIARHTDNRWLSVLFATVLLYVAVRALRESKTPRQESEAREGAVCKRRGDSGRFIWTASCARALALSGSIAGLLSGLLGVGGGFVLVPALKRYTDLAMQSIVPTSLAVIALVSLTGVVSSVVSGGLEWAVALPFSGGALAGMIGGRMIASRLPGARLQKGFGAVAAAVALGMVVKSLA